MFAGGVHCTRLYLISMRPFNIGAICTQPVALIDIYTSQQEDMHTSTDIWLSNQFVGTVADTSG